MKTARGLKINPSLIKSFLSQQANVKNIGIIGVGNMGNGMVTNLCKHFPGQVSAFDVMADNLVRAEEAGAFAEKSVAELASKCGTIITMLPKGDHVCGVMRGSEGILANAAPGTLLIDASTIDPLTSKELSSDALEAGMSMVDAPVSGGVNGAAGGTLTFMVGGTDDDIERATPFLMAMGKNVTHCGGAGTGSTTKLCNNLALAIQMIGTSEALTLGESLGADPAVLSAVMNTSTARCWSSDTYNPVPGVMEGVPSSNDYKGGFASALMEKDLGLAMAAGEGKAYTPLGSYAHEMYGRLLEEGFSDSDFSVVYKYLKGRNAGMSK